MDGKGPIMQEAPHDNFQSCVTGSSEVVSEQLLLAS